MTETIITAIISGLCVAIPSVIATMYQHKNSMNLLEYRLSQIEDKVGKHNGFETKINDLITDQKVISEKIAVINHRIEDLERGT